MDPSPILPSNSDLERRRLESTIDNDLHSLSLSSLPTSTTSHSDSYSFISSSGSSTISMEYPRAETMTYSPQQQSHHFHGPNHGHAHGHGPSGTPRATRNPSTINGRMSSFGGEQSMFIGASPVSTAGHHASAITLGAGIFGKKSHSNYMDNIGNTSEFDPERSLGRLVGELGRVMGSDKLPSRPTSPFSPPRSPSPLPSVMSSQPANLSFTLTRNDPLLSPPSSGGEQTITQQQSQKSKPETNSRFSSLARELGEDLKAARTNPPAPPRRALSDSTSHNIQSPNPIFVNQTNSNKSKDRNNDRLRTLQDENRRSASAPIKSTKDNSLDVTGYTNLMATPAKGGEYGTLNKNGEVGGETANIAGTLATLNARLRALETENSVSRRRVRELEDELERARAEVELAKQDGGKRLRDVIGEKSALEDLVKSLRSHLARLTVEVESNKALIMELRSASSPPRKNATLAPGSPSVSSELAALRREIERLSKEVQRLGGIVEEGLETRKKARGERTMRMEREEMERLVRQVMEEENEDLRRAQKAMEKSVQRASQREAEKSKEVAGPSKLRQGLHTAASTSPTLAPPTVKPNRIAKPSSQHLTPPPSDIDDGLESPTPISRSFSRQASLVQEEPTIQKATSHSRKSKSKFSRRVSHDITNAGPSSPFPSILGDDMEAEFFSPSRKTQDRASVQTASPWGQEFVGAQVQPEAEVRDKASSRNTHRSTSATGSARRGANGEDLPPQTVLSRVVRELEDDFSHYKVIYSELADQYKSLDPASISSKRHVLAEHLREVIDILEIKADQIGDLYELLSFQDKPISHDNNKRENGKWIGKSIEDVLRMVKSSLGEDIFDRLQDDLGKNVNGNGNGRRRKSGGKEI